MTDENPTAADGTTQNEQAAAPKFSIQKIYLKDLSLETPMGTGAFQRELKPKVNQDLNTKTSKVAENLYEVVLRITVTVKDGEETIYLIEAQQAGLFEASGLPNNQLAQVLNSTCPEILFPYSREVIDNLLLKAGFPPLNMPPINFDALFAAAVQQAQQQAQQKEASPAEGTLQ